MLKLAWFTSVWDAQAVVLLRTVCIASRNSDLKVAITVVVCTNEKSPFAPDLAAVAKEYGIPVVHIDTSFFKESSPKSRSQAATRGQEPWRSEYEEALVNRISAFNFDLVVLAGYMWVAGPKLLRSYRMVNLHPAVPGTYAGTRDTVIDSLIRDNAQNAGAMIHIVDSTLDRGPALAYCEIPILGAEWDGIRTRPAEFKTAVERAILAAEPRLLVETLRFLSGLNTRSWPPALSGLPKKISVASCASKVTL